MIVNYYEPLTSFELAPEEAIQHFTAKGLKPTYNWFEMLNEQHDAAFTVAKMMDLDLLETVKGELEKALATGGTLEDFKKALIPTLQKKGWWGKKDVVGPDGFVTSVQLGSASRLENIFRTNLQSAYAAGHWQSIVEGADDQPYLMYDAVDDFKTRKEHAEMDALVFPIDHNFWKTHYPPNGWGCRCGVIQMDADELEDMGLTIGDNDYTPQTYLWNKPGTDEYLKIPVGIDPGFAHNPGIGYLSHLDDLQADKLAKMDTESSQAAKKGIKASKDKAEEAKAAQKAIQAAEAEKAAKAKAKAAAQAELDAIAQGQATTQPTLKKQALNKLTKAGTAKQLADDPEALLAQVADMAADAQQKKEKSKHLSGYKTKVLADKNPTPKQQQVFDSLDDAEKQKVLDDIDKKKAEKLAAAKAAQEPKPATPGQALNLANMKQIGGQGGSNPGGLYYDQETGVKWYIKEPPSEAIARNEHLANLFYRQAGIEVPETQIIKDGDRTLLASRIVEGVQENRQGLRAGSVKGVNESFVFDAWLANWDVVGLVYDNMLVKDNRAIRLDNGGALLFRAQGTEKLDKFGPKVIELDTLRDADLNPSAAATFANVTREDLIEGARKVIAFTDSEIENLIDQAGITDSYYRKPLVEMLIKRRDYIKDKYPEASKRTEAPKPKTARIKPDEFESIQNSRVNGVSIATDKDQIDGNNVVLSHYQDANGNHRTKMWLRLQGEFLDEFDANVTPGSEPKKLLDAKRLYDLELTLAKGVNMQRNKGEGLRDKDVERLDALINEYETTIKALQASNTGSDQLNKVKDAYKFAIEFKQKAVIGQVPEQAWPNVVADAFKTITESNDSNWVEDFAGYNVSNFSRSKAQEVGEKHSFSAANNWIVQDIDGVTVRYASKKNGRAAAGYLELHTEGRDINTASRLFDALDELGVNTARVTPEDRETLYLNKLAKLKLVTNHNRYQEYLSLTTLEEKRAFLIEQVGFDFVNGPDYDPIGKHQAFGHGRLIQYRPDLDPTELRSFTKKYKFYHNPTGLGIGFSSSNNAGDTFLNILRGGGMMSSVMDRFRRGVKGREESVNSDIRTGGANYVFTRALSERHWEQAGFWWKGDIIRRLDAISYDGDKFGNTTDEYQRNYRISDLSELRKAARHTGNETIFRDGLSFFDFFDRVVLPTRAEAERVIEELKKDGYVKWPDGRELNDVIRYKGQG
jgi:SPP1 gp7 family putative phage head morphogenesis protein